MNFYARRYDDAIKHLLKTLDMDPNFQFALFAIGISYLGKAMYKEAIQSFQKLVILTGSSPFGESWLGYAYALSGQNDKALKTLDRLNDISVKKYVSPMYKAIIYIGLGNKDQAFRYLEKAYEDRTFFLVFMKVAMWFDPLRSDPRFKALLKRMNLAKD